MKITRVETWTVAVRQEVPYAVAYGTYESSELVFLRLETDTGLVGYGTAGCDPDVTGETAATVVAALTGVAEPLLRGADPMLRAGLLGELNGVLAEQPSARAAVDIALSDIFGKHLGFPLWKLLGGARDRIVTSITIGILPQAETVAEARRWIGQGFTCLKLKGGLDVDSDIGRVTRVREAVGDSVELRFDANQGYTVKQALKFAGETRRSGVAFIEQPTTAGEPALLGQVRASGLIPVMADECVHDAAGAFHLAAHGYADLLNVKLMKTGGFGGALRVEAVARASGLPIMVGCMDESALGIAAGLHFALGVGAAYADLDGHIGLIGDPATPGLTLRDGVLYPPEGPGLGINL
jgi:L-alanine-DL-glutamate epimerase-like enolase superfamily enzyme